MPRTTSSQINLDAMFRPDSSARKVAERLLTGRPQTRNELVEGLNIAVTTVNRVVEMLVEAGAVIQREVASDGKQAVFRFVDFSPAVKNKFPGLDDEMEIVGGMRVGVATMIDLASRGSEYRGELTTPIGSLPLGRVLRVQGISKVGDDLADLHLVDGDQNYIVNSVRNVTH